MHRCDQRWIYLLLVLIACGCSSIKSYHRDADRSRYYPLAVYSITSIPELSGRLPPGDSVEPGSTVKYLAGTVIFTFGLLAPLCAPLVAVDLAAVSGNSAEISALEESVRPLLPRLEILAEQELLRGYAMVYLTEHNIEARDVADLALPDGADDRARFLEEQGYPMALELSLLLLEYHKYENSLCVSVQARGRTLNTYDNREVGLETARRNTCKTANEWFEGDSLENEVLAMYTDMARQLVDEILFRYQPVDADSLNFRALLPKPDLTDFERFEQRTRNCRPYLDDDCNNTRANLEMQAQLMALHKPKLREHMRAAHSLEFVEVDLAPDFEWSPLQGPGITEVGYFLIILPGEEQVTVTSSRYDGEYPLAKIVVPAGMTYKSERLSDSSVSKPVVLEPCRWYFWGVHARYRLFGKERLTYMSTRVPLLNQQITAFPIRTEPSADDPDCWNQAVDWGRL